MSRSGLVLIIGLILIELVLIPLLVDVPLWVFIGWGTLGSL